MSLTIEKNIPMPFIPPSRTGLVRETLKKMVVGDSFVVEDYRFVIVAQRLYGELNIRIRSRRINRTSDAYRVWLIEKNQGNRTSPPR